MSQKKSLDAGINKNWRPSKQGLKAEKLDYYVDGIIKSDLKVLSEAITKIESQVIPLEFSLQLLDALAIKKINENNSTMRIGISGSPGAGKSTFINALGKYLLDLGKKVAVLAIDPSSQISKGSILGDKTRMYDLSQNPNAFVRPTPSSSTLGGVAAVTKESIELCEAAGFEIVLVETVGVGQSETHLKDLVDVFCLLLLPGAGDELQGIKKGIVEISDLFIINKADGDRIKLAKESQKYYQNALHLQRASDTQWIKKVLTCSSLDGLGFDVIWNTFVDFHRIAKEESTFQSKRDKQNEHWSMLKRQQILSEGFRRMAIDDKLSLDQNDSRFKSLLKYKDSVNNLLSELEK